MERVAMEERFRIRLARIADSCMVGISYGKGEVAGLERMCCGGGAREVATWRSERRASGKSIAVVLWMLTGRGRLRETMEEKAHDEIGRRTGCLTMIWRRRYLH